MYTYFALYIYIYQLSRSYIHIFWPLYKQLQLLCVNISSKWFQTRFSPKFPLRLPFWVFNFRGFSNYIRTPISHFLFQIDLSHIYFLKSKFRTIFPKIPSKDNSLSYFMSPQRQAETGQGLCAGEIIGKRDSKQGFKLMQGILANIGNLVTIVLRSHSIFILLDCKQKVPGKIIIVVGEFLNQCVTYRKTCHSGLV